MELLFLSKRQPMAHTSVANLLYANTVIIFVAHRVPNGAWMLLALELAKTHVLGFKVVKPAGVGCIALHHEAIL